MTLKNPTKRQLSVGLFLAVALIIAGFLWPPSHHGPEQAEAMEEHAAEHVYQAEHETDYEPGHETGLETGHETENETEHETEHETGHNGTGWMEFPFFFALFGFIGCILLIIVAKSLGAMFLQQKEDIYD